MECSMWLSVRRIGTAAFLGCLLGSQQAQAARPPAPPFNLTGLWAVTAFGGFPNPPPLNATAAKAKQEAFAKSDSGVGISFGTCLPPGLPSIMIYGYPMQIAQTPNQVLFINEFLNSIRWIYLDSRSHPDPEEKSFNGHSVGHWEGDTLVVDTANIDDRGKILVSTGFQSFETPVTISNGKKMHVVERIKMKRGGGSFVDEMTITDPDMFTEPWVTVLEYKKSHEELKEYVCENNRDATAPAPGSANNASH